MKVLRYAVLIFCVLIPYGMSAQTDPKVSVEAFKSIIKKYVPRRMDNLAAEIQERHKKNPDVIFGIAEAFYRNSGVHDSVYSGKYIDKVLEIAPGYSKAYSLKAEIFLYYGDTLSAVRWYEKGIAANPKVPRCYLDYARLLCASDVEKTKEVMRRLKGNVPDYPVNRDMARLFDNLATKRINTTENLYYALENFKLATPDSLTAYDWILYANYYLGLKDYENVVSVCRLGLDRFPRKRDLNRFAFYANYNMHKWEDAVFFAEELLHNSDTVVPRAVDYLYCANSYRELKNYSKALQMYNELHGMDGLTDAQKRDMYRDMAECYTETGAYDEAEKYFLSDVEARRSEGKSAFAPLYYMAAMYSKQAEGLDGEAKIAAYRKADRLYAEASKENDDRIEYAVRDRYRLNVYQLNDDYVKGKSVPVAMRLIELFESRGDKSVTNNTYRVHVYQYMAQIYLGYYQTDIKTNLSKAKYYLNKILEYEPEHEGATKALAALKSDKKRRR
ncbi:tetratricopeptide repeat protein [Xylanibacter muris]|uniref:Tetratricopeptide repeat protein n=1 Tax=Xylanibacter muris TaxID=2736290 RepID=A0ABX2APV4_9BACT|nr:hypothetical protein [Xylanibacter muris]NPD93228.1 hypothetical protein [Xylanibacter muris]